MLGQFLVLILVVGFFGGDIMELTYSAMTQSEPDVIVSIDNGGGVSQEGNLFGNELWYPGMEKEGIIRISNNYKTIKISSLGVAVELTRVREGYGWDQVNNSFLQHMKLTITKGKLAVFDKEIIKDKSLGELLAASDNIMIEETDQFSISKGDFVDLKYKLLMDEESGNELQGLSANVSLLINIHERIINDDDDNGDDNGDDNDDDPIIEPEDPKDEDEVIEVPDDLIPLGIPHWAHDCIITLLRHGIIVGYPDGTIRPEQPITRAESAALIAKALNLEKQDKSFSKYSDPIPEWAMGHISAVSKEGIFVGYPMNLFKPNNNITREEMVTVLIKGFEKELCPDTELNFTDKESIGDWSMKYVKAGVGHEILRGYPDGSFKPQNEITRAEAFTIICKLLGLHDEHI